MIAVADVEMLCYLREFSLLLFPNDDILAPGADFVVHSADGVKKANFDTSVLYKGSLERKRIIHVMCTCMYVCVCVRVCVRACVCVLTHSVAAVCGMLK